MIRVVVIGYGPVAARFVEGMLDSVRAGEVALAVLGAEQADVYNRVLVAEYAVGRADRDTLDIGDTAAARAAGVDVRLGEAATGIDRERRRVRTSTGSHLPYDRLVLATGARANVPTLAGLERSRRHRLARPHDPADLDRGARPLPRGVVTLRDLTDAELVADAVRDRRRIVVLGAGVLGMEFALAAAERGARVVVVHHGPSPMARNLDVAGGRTLALAASAAGVEMVAHSRAEGILTRTDDAGRAHFDALLCADGKQVHGDLLLLSAGAAPRVELAADAGLVVSTGVVVDEHLRSWTDPHVFAIGDCAQVATPGSAAPDGRVPGASAGLIGPGWRQADALVELLRAEAAGRSATLAPPAERPTVVMLKAEGVDVCAGGVVDADPWDADPQGHSCGRAWQVTVWADPARGGYVKLVTRGGVLEGFVCVGMPRTAAELTLLFERGSELPADRTALLRLDSTDALVAPASDPFAPDATVCWCNGVTAGRITEAIDAGDDTVACVGRSTRAGTGCGGCKGRIAELLARAGKGETVSAG
ncbi:FAD-dependent oxidoreductase [Herbiconiux sp. SYSU D00978]|uniref:FAD-dependent oxidoreductase n=1 Tax=Herbiconiux sp. SYSU D00978 TaxID=2812562 RepID=UPI0027DDE06B|nr:FAD-dependent oxidoreductase [Herbiconiux sp. SYSU D00978]